MKPLSFGLPPVAQQREEFKELEKDTFHLSATYKIKYAIYQGCFLINCLLQEQYVAPYLAIIVTN